MQRNTSIDSIRGVMILYMVFYHVSLDCKIISIGKHTSDFFIYDMMSFFMHSFFFFSGYFFIESTKVTKFIKKKASSLLIPYVIYNILSFIVFALSKQIFPSIEAPLSAKVFFTHFSLPYNWPLWFLWSLFFVNVTYKLVHQIGGIKLNSILSMFMFLLAFYLNGKDCLFSVDNIPLAYCVFHIGYLFKCYQDKVNNKFYIASIILFLIFNLFYPQRIDFVVNKIADGDYISCFIYSLSAIIVFIYITDRIPNNKVSTTLSKVGKCSMIIYATHRPIMLFLLEPFSSYVGMSLMYEMVFISCFFLLFYFCLIKLKASAKVNTFNRSIILKNSLNKTNSR